MSNHTKQPVVLITLIFYKQLEMSNQTSIEAAQTLDFGREKIISSWEKFLKMFF